MTTNQSSPTVDALWARIREVIGDQILEIAAEVEAAESAAGIAEAAADRATFIVDPGGALASKADLVGGVVPTSQIPAVALTKPHQVEDRAALLALTDVQEGDVGVVTAGPDRGTLMLGDGPSSEWESWVPLATSPDAPVQSVNGQTGTVVLGAGDVGAASAGHSHIRSQITDLPEFSWGTVGDSAVLRDAGGHIPLPSTAPSADRAVRRDWVEAQVAGVPQIHSVMSTDELVSLDAKVGDLIIMIGDYLHLGIQVATLRVDSVPLTNTTGYSVLAYSPFLAKEAHSHLSSHISDMIDTSAGLGTGVQNRTVKWGAGGEIRRSNWAARPPADADSLVPRGWVEARGPQILKVTSLPTNPNSNTLYVVVP